MVSLEQKGYKDPQGNSVMTFEALPYALSFIRRQFQENSLNPVYLTYDGLEMVITPKDGWDMNRLP